jgi:hypothetical protein
VNTTRLAKLAGTILASLFAFSAFAAEDTMHYYLKNPCWVCATPEAYDDAIKAHKALTREQSLEELEKDLFAKQLCIFIDDDEIGGLTSPYLTILETRDAMTRVSFVIKFEKRLALLNRQLDWYKFNGWTEMSNLKELW